MSDEGMPSQLRRQAGSYSVRSVGNIPLAKADIHHIKTNRLEWKAAKLIDDLQAENERLRSALKPFVELANEIEHCAKLYTGPESSPENWAKSCTWDDLTNAREALNQKGGE